MQSFPHLALVVGEPAGIGPEICARAIASPQVRHMRLTVFGDRDQVLQKLQDLGSPPPAAHDIHWQHLPLPTTPVPGTLDVRNAGQVLQAIDLAAKGCLKRDFDGMVTGPVHKGLLNEAGHRFSGMTERLAELSNGCDVVMMLATPALRVALVTTHLPLAQVPTAITTERLLTVVDVLHRALRFRFGIADPRIAVLGLNPHAGEGGHLGREEVEVIEPVLQQLRQQGMQLIGPLPADTAFLPRRLQEFDAVLAMYHDQGLPVLKYSGFEQAVNITLGLPFVRVAVDHGTALDLAGSGRADPSSLLQALRVASQLASAVEPGCA